MDRCPCESKQIVKRKIGSALHFGSQCARCGRWEAVAKANLTAEQISGAAEFDETRAEIFWNGIRERERTQYAIEREERNVAWWAAYSAYLLSDRWRDKRDRVLERDGGLFQACLRRKATQVHHLTYEHCQNASGEFGYEPLFDLESICDVCHRALTKLDRERRAS